jgi:murein DD-endopeptidase MepM/ murein hydrolase activator NlpD
MRTVMVSQMLTLLVAAAPPPPRRGAADAGPRERLKTLTVQLSQEEEDIDRLAREEGSLLAALESAGQKAQESGLRAATASKAERELRAKADEAKQRADEAAVRADAALASVEPRLRAWQRLSHERRLRLLLDSQTAQGVAQREALLRSVLGKDLSELREAQLARDEARTERAAFEKARAAWEAQATVAADEAAEAQVRHDHHAALLSLIREQRLLHERVRVELAAAQAQLAAVVANLPPDRMSSTDFAHQKGKLTPPSAGGVEVGFGPILNPRFHTVTLQKGIDMRVPEGSAVRAVWRGRVVFAGSLQGYGNLVILDHGDGFYTLYAHLRAISPELNAIVDGGDLVGEVGATGSLKGPYLYFELRHHGEALDPERWLSSAGLAGQ